MRVFFFCTLFFSASALLAEERELYRSFFLSLEQLDFSAARRASAAAQNPRMRSEMMQLAELLYHEGQGPRPTYQPLAEHTAGVATELEWIQMLKSGYECLFFDGEKTEAYKKFYVAYQFAQDLGEPVFVKASLFAFFKYYRNQLVYRSDSFEPHLKHFERLQSEFVDKVWLTLLKAIFYSKKLQGVDKEYDVWAKQLDQMEKVLEPRSPLLAFVYFEKGMKYRIGNALGESITYFKKVIQQADTFPFLHQQRLHAYLQLMDLETTQKNFADAKIYYNMARHEIEPFETLRSTADLDLYASVLYAAIGKYDSAYYFLRKGYMEDVELNYHNNAIEIDRLNVELQTREKENANLRLRQDRIWLIFAVVGLALLLVASYFVFLSLRAKNKIHAKEKQVQAMRLEKALKDQEMFGIDAMLEGQEKERQRIAGDLHDNLGSLLATIKLHFHSLMSTARPDSEQHALMHKTDALLNEAYQKVRAMAHAGNAGVDPKEGLLPAVRGFAKKVSVLDRLTIQVEEHGMQHRLENSVEILLFRVIQELITNIIKHAEATEAYIHLTHYGDAVNLMIEDNGVGFDHSRIKPTMGMGLYSIQKKVENLGGRVTIEAIRGKGTTVIIDILL